MTTLDAKAIKAAARKITGGSTFDADERIGIAIDVVRTYLAKASPALSSLPAQAVDVRNLALEEAAKQLDHLPDPQGYARNAASVIRSLKSALVAPSQPAAVGVTDERVDRAARALSVWKIKPGMAGYRMAARDMLEAALRSTP